MGYCVGVHESVLLASGRYLAHLDRQVYITPRNYLDFIATYRTLLANNTAQLVVRKHRLGSGLGKLMQVTFCVDGCKYIDS